MILKEQFEESQRAAELDKKRKTNILVHRLPELESDTWKDRQEHDQKVIQDLLHVLEIETEVIEHHRLGKRFKEVRSNEAAPGGSAVLQAQTKRPLKVVLKDETDREKVLANLSKLRDATPELKSLRISPDLNLTERNEVRRLVALAKNLTQEEEGEYRHIVKGMNIIRVKAKKTTTQETPQEANQQGNRREPESRPPTHQ